MFSDRRNQSRFAARLLRWLGGTAVLTALSLPAFALEPGEFDPAGFDALLKRYVKGDYVDYQAWKENGSQELDAFLEEASDYDLTSMLGKEPRGAFLINLYNAWAVRQILDHYPVESVRDIPGFFDENKRLIAGEERSLNDIEDALAGTMKYFPDFAFALAPGAVGGPPLMNQAYTSENLDWLMAKAARLYLAREGNLELDREANVLHVPPQLEKHRDIFDAQQRGLAGYLSIHMDLADVVAMQGSPPEHEVVEVDWSLNDAARAPEDSPKAGEPSGGDSPHDGP